MSEKKPTIHEKFKSAKVQPYDKDQHEYDICNEIKRWAHHPEARCIPQYLALKGIGWGTFKYWIERSYPLKNAYEHAISVLWCRWFDYLIENKKIPSHHIRMAEKYLNVYDGNLIHILNEKAKEAAQAQIAAPRNYTAEDYRTLEMEGEFKKKYEENEKKRKEQG